MTISKTNGRSQPASLQCNHVTNVEMQDILEEILKALPKEKLAVSVEALTTLVLNVQQKQPNLPNLDMEGNQREKTR